MRYAAVALAGIVVGFFMALLFFRIQTGKRLKRRMRTRANGEKGKQGGEKISFTKAVLSLVLLTYFFGLAVGVYVALKDYSQFGILATYIATPTTTVIALYCWKSKAENMIKLKKYFPEETRDIPVDLNNISS
ncbi:MAG: hypothetical protein NC331_14500 [Lachnospiraceae bacterium]|nr:hypothetical protein [Lachnospiraceae bacterium]MCM1240574.1 hypothetical protein [Lachnospiraceae bacterium]